MTAQRVGCWALTVSLLLGGLSGCFGRHAPDTVIRVLASSELTDMQPILDELRDETGVELAMDFRGTVDAANVLNPDHYGYDLAWLSSDRYFQLKLDEAGFTGPKPLSTSIMLSPIAVGVKSDVARALRGAAPDGHVSWADLADRAAAGSLRFAMADPHTASSGLAALVGVASAASVRAGSFGSGRDLRSATGLLRRACVDRGPIPRLVDEFVAHETDVVP
jgi:Ca-activated chloride channel family protein